MRYVPHLGNALVFSEENAPTMLCALKRMFWFHWMWSGLTRGSKNDIFVHVTWEYTRKNANLFRIVENSLQQCWAAQIVQCCQQYCSAPDCGLIQAQQCWTILLKNIDQCGCSINRNRCVFTRVNHPDSFVFSVWRWAILEYGWSEKINMATAKW